MDTVLKRIECYGIVPVISIDHADRAVPLARALREGGLPVEPPPLCAPSVSAPTVCGNSPPSSSVSVPSSPPPRVRAAMLGAGLSPASLRGAESPRRLSGSRRTVAARLQSPRCPTTNTRRRLWATPKY